MEYLNILALISVLYLSGIFAQQRSPPGVNPQQYQQGNPNAGQQYQQPPQQQQQYNQMGAAPPGVPPGQYQQQQQQQQQYQQQPQAPPPQQQQYQQQQQQQPPQQQQYQQPPPQQQQQQFQQAPQHTGGGHNHPEQQRVLHGSSNIKEEREHIKDHMEVPLDTSGMSEEELQYHYFKMHDADNNNRLDGQELIKSLFHWHDSSNHDAAKTGQTPPPPKIFTDVELTNMIDPIMDQDDRNRDGYIDYPEFVHAQSKAAAAAAAGGS